MSMLAFRARRGLSLEAWASELGLRSRGHLSDVESGRKACGLRLALRIEQTSAGELRAIDLVSAEDAALLRAAIDNARAEAPA